MGFNSGFKGLIVMCTFISVSAFQYLCTSVSIITCCPSRHWCLDAEVYHMLPALPLTTFLLTPILSTSLHPRYLSYPLTIPDTFLSPQLIFLYLPYGPRTLLNATSIPHWLTI